MRLKKWVKVTLTVILVMSAIMMYSKVGVWGALAQSSRLYENLTLCGWIWLMLQPFMIGSVWEN